MPLCRVRGAGWLVATALAFVGALTVLTTDRVDAQAAPAVPPPGGITVAVTATDDPAALAASLPFPVDSISAFDVWAQQWHVYVPGAPAFANTLSGEDLQPGTIVWIRRSDRGQQTPAGDVLASAPPAVDAAQALPPPPRGGLTLGSAGTGALADFLDAQAITAASVIVFDVAAQQFLVHVPGAPAFAHTLDDSDLHPDSIAWVRRDPDDPVRLPEGPRALPRLAQAGPVDAGAFTEPTDLPIVAPPPAPAEPVVGTAEYRPSDADFPNPERGWFSVHTSGTLSGGYHPLPASQLARDDRTLVKRYFMLTDYIDGDISGEYLDAVRRDFEAARRAGIKLIVRFSYTNDEHASVKDASRSQMLRHIDQLAPVLRDNVDVIAVVQAGFIGVWGEWAFTDRFGDPYGNDFSDRQQVLERLLQAVPTERYVQVRAPRYKQRMPLSPALADRVAFHNDCFLRGDDDAGTFVSDGERAYLASETRTRPMGGETCAGPSGRSNDALAELERFHWSFLNRDFHPAQVSAWRDDGTAATISRRLGYRFELVSGAVSSAGDALTLELSVRNVGWAAPYNPRDAVLVLRHRSSGAAHRIPLAADPRTWTPGETTHVREQVSIPGDLPRGEYDLLLHLSDPAESLRDRPEYAIRVANEDLWEPSTGYNRLQLSVRID